MKKQAGHLERNAFTLIELLVVIAIISLLVSILLPSLSKAKGLARSLVCQTRLRNMGSAEALAFHERDNGEYTPVFTGSTSPWSQWFGDELFRMSLGLPVPAQIPSEPYYVTREYLCPDCGNLIESNTTPGLFHWELSYGWNITDVQAKEKDGKPHIVYEAALVNSPADKMMISDAVDWMTWLAQANAYMGEGVPAIGAPAYRHNEKANVVFFDGHVESLDSYVFLTNENYFWEAYR